MIAVLYVVVVLLVSSTGNRPATIATAWGCVILTLFAFLMSHTEQYSGGAIARCVVSLLAIATTSVLSLRNQAATASLHEHIQERMQAEQALERSEAFLLDAQRLSRTASIATSLPEGTDVVVRRGVSHLRIPARCRAVARSGPRTYASRRYRERARRA